MSDRSLPRVKPTLEVFTNIQALRAIAALLVVFNHFAGFEAQLFPGQPLAFNGAGHFGRFGVDLFFVISGFIMIVTTWRLFQHKDASLQFFARRCVRIYPPYWLVIIPITVFYSLAPHRYTNFHPIHADLFASFFLLPQATHPILVVSWTLVFEMFFYLIFSAMLLLPQRFVPFALVAWFFSELLLWSLFRNARGPALSFLGNPSAIEFIFGAAIALAYVRGALSRFGTLAYLGIIPFPIVCCLSAYHQSMPAILRVFAVGIPAAILLLSVVSLESQGRLRTSAFIVSIGDASYALYLWHLPLLVVLAQVFGHVHHHNTRIAHVAFFTGVLVFLIGFAYVSYRFIERPLTSALNKALHGYFGVRPKMATP